MHLILIYFIVCRAYNQHDRFDGSTTGNGSSGQMKTEQRTDEKRAADCSATADRVATARQNSSYNDNTVKIKASRLGYYLYMLYKQSSRSKKGHHWPQR
jgi:hypothetical protein